MYIFYILKSQANGAYYIGSCEDIDLRLDQHNGGAVKSTKRYLPWVVVYTKKYPTRTEALRRERQVKSWKKRVAIEKLLASKI